MPLRDPRLRALRARRVPVWWLDAKLGIFVHWTPASVPAFAPVDTHIGELVKSGRRDALARVPYAEWYENSLRFPDSPVARHHREVWRNRPYEQFADDWVAGLAQWDPNEMGRALCRNRRALRRVGDEAHGWLLPVADRRSQSAAFAMALSS